MGYVSVRLDDSIHIDELYTVHYFEYMNNFSFEGERHNFWEFLYVDKGEIGVTADNNYSLLKKGDIIFHKPNEFHTVKATENSAPNLVVISFATSSPAMHFFEGKLLRIDELGRNLLADIVFEARNCFSCRLDNPYLQHMTKKAPSAFGAEQMLRLHIEHLLIHLIRINTGMISPKNKMNQIPPKSTKTRNDCEIFNRVVNYLENNIHSHVTIEQICHDNLVGRSQLQKIFREKSSKGVIEYFSSMKIDAAKQMIRTNRMNFTQISEQMGYTSIHYFSRQFKKITGMTPSEYASSVKAMAEGSFDSK